MFFFLLLKLTFSNEKRCKRYNNHNELSHFKIELIREHEEVKNISNIQKLS